MRATSEAVRPESEAIADDGGMSRSLKTYDHRLRDLVRRTGDLTIETRAGVPRSTAARWLLSPNRPTVSLNVFSMTEQDLQTEVQRLRQRLEQLRVIARILFACFRALDIDLPLYDKFSRIDIYQTENLVDISALQLIEDKQQLILLVADRYFNLLAGQDASRANH